MTATTLGDLFPDLGMAITPHRRYARAPQKAPAITSCRGTADTLKALYPEIESWHPVLVTKAWLHWCGQSQQASSIPETRDERFPDYLVQLLLDNMRAADGTKHKKGITLTLSERIERVFSGEEKGECH